MYYVFSTLSVNFILIYSLMSEMFMLAILVVVSAHHSIDSMPREPYMSSYWELVLLVVLDHCLLSCK